MPRKKKPAPVPVKATDIEAVHAKRRRKYSSRFPPEEEPRQLMAMSDVYKVRQQQRYRETIDWEETMGAIVTIEERLMAMTLPQITTSEDGVIETVPPPRPEPAVVGALKVVLDSKWRRINKLIPDARHDDEEAGGVSGRVLDPEELERRLVPFLKSVA